jgi:hypothetical protein
MKPTVYVETTVPSYLTAWASRDLVRAAHQQITREWWSHRDKFDLYAAADRLTALSGIPLLQQGPEVIALAEALMRDVPLPEKAAADSLHIATAAVHGMRYLLTWNCTHIANVVLRPQIEAVCRTSGFEPPLICTPEELSGD